MLYQVINDEETIAGYGYAAWDDVNGRFALVPAYGSASNSVILDGDAIPAPVQGFGPTAFLGDVLYMLRRDGTAVVYWDGTDWSSPIAVPVPTYSGSLSALKVLIYAGEGFVYVLFLASDGTGGIWRLENGVFVLVCDDIDIRNIAGPAAGYLSYTSFYANRQFAILGPNVLADDRLSYAMVRFNVITPTVASVSEIIAEQCERAGETRYDVSEIPESDILHGYKLQNPASARSNIDPLLTAFAIYIVDEDGAIKFKKYEDIVSEASIAYDELGQAEDGADPADAMPLNRAQEIDLPRSVAASYIEPSFDYQTASEKEVRQVTEAAEDLIVELPIATNSNHAKQVASMILYAKWRAQNTRSFKTSRKYAFLSSGDGVTVEYPRGTFRLWRITSMTDTGVLCEFNVEPADAELYTQTAIGATGYVGQQVTPLAPTAIMQIVDGPLLTDAGNTAGPYVALDGPTDDWPGGELLVGDDDTNLVPRGAVEVPAPTGVAETALGSWSLGIVDETNLVTVNVGNDELSSITREVLLAGTANAFALGVNGRWEIAQFQRADSLGNGRYILSGLRRGLRGTEANTSTHLVGDVFVLLIPAGMLKPSAEVGSIGQSKSYRAITKGRSVNSASSQEYASTGEPLRPFSPVDLRKSFSGTDIVFTWHRRTRMSENVLAGIFPLGEASERYLLELCTDGTFDSVFRTLQVTSETATYTEAMQDFDGYVSGPLYVRVVQISDSVGRGHPLEATI
jgi:hypothetical protein